MSRSKIQFSRWETKLQSTWTFQVYNKYSTELNEMLWADKASNKEVYKSLGAKKAQWTDDASKHLEFEVPIGEETFRNLKDWSNSLNKFHKWTNLNALMAMSANFETYLATVIELAIESDPGVLFGMSHSIDGIEIIKRGGRRNIFLDEIIKSLTKGDWNSRTNSFEKYFGSIPPLLNEKKGELDKIRKLRNNVGHAFGRDIDDSRNHEVKEIQSIESLSDTQLKKYQKILWSTAKNIDKFLLKKHIGEYQSIAFYHRMYNTLRLDSHQSERAITLKKKLGNFGDIVGKEICKGLVKYYEEL